MTISTTIARLLLRRAVPEVYLLWRDPGHNLFDMYRDVECQFVDGQMFVARHERKLRQPALRADMQGGSLPLHPLKKAEAFESPNQQRRRLRLIPTSPNRPLPNSHAAGGTGTTAPTSPA